MPSATITSDGRITIPAEVRAKLQLKTGDRIDFVFLAGGDIAIRPTCTPLESLRGILKTERNTVASPEEMDEGIRESVRGRWARLRARNST